MAYYSLGGQVIEAASEQEARAKFASTPPAGPAGAAQAPTAQAPTQPPARPNDGYTGPEEFRPTGFVSPKQAAGSALYGAMRTAERLVEPIPGLGSPERVRELDEVLKNKYTDPGWRMVGETGALWPVGGAAAAPVKAIAAKVGGRWAPKVLKLAGNALEGGVMGGAVSEQGAGAEGAEVGAGLNTALGVLPPVLRRVGAKGLVKASEAAKAATDWVSARKGQVLDLPLAQKAKEGGLSGAVKWLYKDVLPLSPSATTVLEKQAANAGSQWRRRHLQEIADTAGIGDLPKNVGDKGTIQTAVRDMDTAFKQKVNDTVGGYTFTPHPDAHEFAVSQITKNTDVVTGQANKAADDFAKLVKNNTDKNGQISGSAINDMRDQLIRKAESAGSREEALAYREAANSIDEWVRSDMIDAKTAKWLSEMEATGSSKIRLSKAQQQSLEDFQRWQRANKGYEQFRTVDKAVSSTSADKGGAFDIEDLEKAMKGDVVEGGKIKPVVEHGRSSVGQPVAEQSIGGKRLAYAGAAAAGLGGSLLTPLSIPLVAGGLAATRGLASPKAQKFLMGEYGLQQALEKRLRENWARPAEELGRLGRAGVTSANVDEE